MAHTLHIGLLVNPLAGLGGSLGLKGSDGVALRHKAQALDAAGRQRALQRVIRTVACLPPDRVRVSTWAGEMGAAALTNFRGEVAVLGAPVAPFSTAADTNAAESSTNKAEDSNSNSSTDSADTNTSRSNDPHQLGQTLAVPFLLEMVSPRLAQALTTPFLSEKKQG